MEGATVGVYRRLTRYWQRKRYERLDGGEGRRRGGQVESSAAGMGGRRKRWGIRVSQRVRLFRLRLPSPKALLIRLRDAYVRLMLSLSNSRVFAAGGPGGVIGAGFGGQAVANCRPFGAGPRKEYDEKVLVEIYKSLAAQGQLACAAHL